MRGLLRKDILMMKDGIGIYLIFIILYSLFSFFLGHLILPLRSLSS